VDANAPPPGYELADRIALTSPSQVKAISHPVRTTILMGRNDETVSFEGVAEVWKRWEGEGVVPGSKFVELPEGDHGLVDYAPLIAEEIEGAAHDRHHA